jgi:hypothetical protein
MYVCKADSIHPILLRALVTSKMDIEMRKKLVKCYILSTALYGAETETVWGSRSETTAKF